MKCRLSFSLLLFAIALLSLRATALATVMTVSANSIIVSPSAVDGNYTTTHLFIDEIAGDSVPITIFFDPQTTNVRTAEVFTNLNRRDKATTLWAKHTFTVSGVEQNATRPSNVNLIVSATTDVMRGSSVTVFGTANYDGTYRVVSVPAANKIEIARPFMSSQSGTVNLNYEEGIVPFIGSQIATGDDSHYYKTYTMNVGGNGYFLTLFASKTGAYRITARYQLNTESATTWHYFNDDNGHRDHAVVVTPKLARDIRMYEMNPINVNATGTLASQRGTIADLADNTKRWNLNYAATLGINWLWFQPIHPFGVDGRQTSAQNINDRTFIGFNGCINTSSPNEDTYIWNQGSPYHDVNYGFALGSPYAVKNFFEIEPRLTRNGSDRAAAKTEFANFVAAADAAGVSVMFDAAFNHTSYDAEFGNPGVQLFAPDSNATETSRFRDYEVRFYSRTSHYDQRASYYNSLSDPNNPDTDIAVAPDRYDFGKFLDTVDVYFGRYAALVPQPGGANCSQYLNEGDWVDYSVGDESSSGDGNAHFDTITQNVWHYFGQYFPYWLAQTGYSGHNSTPADGDATTRLMLDTKGVDGLRADFGQGLPPQCWEYMINVARNIKWTTVFMAESLDGGVVGYRSARHFDILNENIIFSLKSAATTTDYRGIYDARRTAYGQGLVLLNTISHDEDNYNDPWQAVLRYAANSTIDGAPMIFPGQELGIVTDPNGFNGSGYNFGYDLFEKNFGKWIPLFKTYNSMTPLWNNVDPSNPTYNFDNAQLKPVYAGINAARQFSGALRSSNRYYLNLKGSGTPQQSIFSVAKYETPNGSPATTDVVFAFANLDRNNDQSGFFDVSVSQNGSNLFGIKSNRTYDVKNIAAYLGAFPGADQNRRNYFLNRQTGANLLSNGLFVGLKKVPSGQAGWSATPYEAQYLKLYDVTAPSTTPGTATPPNAYLYGLGNNVTVSWNAAPSDGEVTPCYKVIVNGNPNPFVTCSTTTTLSGSIGDTLTVVIQTVNPSDNSVTGPASSPVNIKLIDPNGDDDGDGMTNSAEDTAGTNPFDANSKFRITSVTTSSVTWTTVPNRKYQLQVANTPVSTSFMPIGPVITATGSSFSESVSVSPPAFFRVQIVP